MLLISNIGKYKVFMKSSAYIFSLMFQNINQNNPWSKLYMRDCLKFACATTFLLHIFCIIVLGINLDTFIGLATIIFSLVVQSYLISPYRENNPIEDNLGSETEIKVELLSTKWDRKMWKNIVLCWLNCICNLSNPVKFFKYSPFPVKIHKMERRSVRK